MTWKRGEAYSQGGREAKLHWESHVKDPWHWVNQAWMFKRAAEEIDTFSLVGRGFSNNTESERDRELKLLIPIYRFLLGISFENLLKGIIIAHGKTVACDGKLLTWFKSHDVRELVRQIDKNRLSVTPEEIAILAEFKEYVVWQGRYPIPTDVKNHVVGLGFSSTIHTKGLALWGRLYKHVNELPKQSVD